MLALSTNITAMGALLTLAFNVGSASAQAAPVTKVTFVDKCSGLPTAVSMPDGTGIMVEIRGLAPKSSVLAKITLTAPAFGNDDSRGKQKNIVIKRTVRASESGKAVFGNSVDLDETSMPAGGPHIVKGRGERIWNAQVEWNQGPGGQAGYGFASVYKLENIDQKFFKVTGKPLCLWEDPAKIDSEYFFNAERKDMALARERLIDNVVELSKGVDVGVVPNTIDGYAGTIATPLISQTNSLGWLFGGVRDERSMIHSSSFSQHWTLGQNQGGYFTLRRTFSRVPVIEYALSRAVVTSDNRSCPVWKKSRSGVLDIGVLIDEFIVVPRSLSDPVHASEFFEKMRPTINTCGAPVETSKMSEARVPGGSANDFLFFYPDTDLKEKR